VEYLVGSNLTCGMRSSGMFRKTKSVWSDIGSCVECSNCLPNLLKTTVIFKRECVTNILDLISIPTPFFCFPGVKLLLLTGIAETKSNWLWRKRDALNNWLSQQDFLSSRLSVVTVVVGENLDLGRGFFPFTTFLFVVCPVEARPTGC
jgi:hypothetical protein